jgi:hypothetical protein
VNCEPDAIVEAFDNKLDVTVESCDDRFDEIHYDMVDILPPFCKYF